MAEPVTITETPDRTATRSLVPVIVATGMIAVAAAAWAPGLVAAGSVAAVVVMFAATRPVVGLLALVAVGILESSMPEPFGTQLTPVKLAGLLCFGTFFLEALVTGRKLRLDRSHAVLGLLLALALVSTLAARSPGDALSTTLRYASFVGLYVVATQFDDDAVPRRIAWVSSLAATVAAVLAIRNFLDGTTALAAPRYGDSNDLAFLLVTTLPLTAWLLRGSRAWARLAVVAMAAVLTTATVLSLSRGALVALGVGVLWHALTERRHLPALILAGIVSLAVAFAAAGVAERQLATALEQKERIATENVETRLDAWQAAAELAVDHPVLGVGPGNFGFYYFEKTGRPPGTFGLRVVHDAYLDVAAELGLTGLLLFLAFLAIVFRRASVAVVEHRGPPGLAASVRTALVIAMVASLTLSEQYYPPFWVLGALATIVWVSGRDGRATS